MGNVHAGFANELGGAAEGVAPRSSRASALYEAARALERLAHRVRSEWSSWDDGTKHVVMCLAYADWTHRPPLWSSPRAFGRWVLGNWIVVNAVLRGNRQALLTFVGAQTRFKNAVLDAIEEDDATHREDRSAIVKAFDFDPTSGERVDPDRAYDVLMNV